MEGRDLIAWDPARLLRKCRCPMMTTARFPEKGCGHVQVCGISLTCYVLLGRRPNRCGDGLSLPWHAIQCCNFPICSQSALWPCWPHSAWSSFYCSVTASLRSDIHRAEQVWSRVSTSHLPFIPGNDLPQMQMSKRKGTQPSDQLPNSGLRRSSNI